jgi:hypothetical protein
MREPARQRPADRAGQGRMPFRGPRSAAHTCRLALSLFPPLSHCSSHLVGTGVAVISRHSGDGARHHCLCARPVAVARPLLSRHGSRHRQSVRSICLFRAVRRDCASSAKGARKSENGTEHWRQTARQLLSRHTLRCPRSNLALIAPCHPRSPRHETLNPNRQNLKQMYACVHTCASQK